MLLVLEQLFILYVFLFSGWLIGKLKKDKASHCDILSVLIVNLFLPCKVFSTFANNFTVLYFKEKYHLVIASVTLISVIVLVSFFLSKVLTKHEYERKVFRYSLAISNYAYLGYVLIESVFGDAFLAMFIFFAIPFIVYTYTFGYALLTGGSNPMKRLLNPITASILIGMLFGLTGLKLPDVLSRVVSMASSCVGPLSMLLTGITLSTFALRKLVTEKKYYVFALLRLVVMPAAVYAVFRLLGLDTILPMAVIITCMPCGLNTIVFPKLIGEDCRLGAGLALITHIFALATLPFWLSVIVK